MSGICSLWIVGILFFFMYVLVIQFSSYEFIALYGLLLLNALVYAIITLQGGVFTQGEKIIFFLIMTKGGEEMKPYNNNKHLYD